MSQSPGVITLISLGPPRWDEESTDTMGEFTDSNPLWWSLTGRRRSGVQRHPPLNREFAASLSYMRFYIINPN